MSVRRALPLIVGIFALSGCQPKPAVDQSATITALRDADQAWLKVFAGRDTSGAVAGVEATGSVMAPNAPIATGPAAIKAFFEGIYALPNMTIKWEPADIQVAQSGDLGYTRGSYELGFTDPKGGQITDKGKYATVWHKQADGTWKVALDIFNSDLPAPGM